MGVVEPAAPDQVYYRRATYWTGKSHQRRIHSESSAKVVVLFALGSRNAQPFSFFPFAASDASRDFASGEQLNVTLFLPLMTAKRQSDSRN